jgi:hypothetical protein
MGVFVSTVAALSTFYPEAKQIADPNARRFQIHRLIAKTPTLAAFAHRHSIGMPFAYPDNDLSYAGNFLNMMFKGTEVRYKPHPVLEHALMALVGVDVEDPQLDAVDRDTPIQERDVTVVVTEGKRQWYVSHAVVPLRLDSPGGFRCPHPRPT